MTRNRTPFPRGWSRFPERRWRWVAASVLLLMVTVTLASAPTPSRVVFGLAAGPAEEALKQFARQSGRPVLFPSALVRGVHTNAVRGEFTCAEALERLLAGTPLLAKEDEKTGAIAVTKRPSVAEKVVELPPYVVEEPVTPPWRYAKAADAEVLTRVSDDLTEDLVARSRRMHQLLEIILPKRLQFSLPTPTLYVFFNASGQSEALTELVNRLQGETKARPASREKIEARAIPNYRFWDPDLLAIFFVIDERRLEPQQLMLTPDYVRYVMENRTPTLPRWLVEGFLELYGRVLMTTQPVRSAVGPAAALPSSRVADEGITLRPAQWVSDEETATVRKSPRRARKLLPLAKVFTELPADAVDDPDGRTWVSEAALFIRWCVEDKRAEGRRTALWKLVEQASGGAGVNEALFKACFKFDYATAEEKLSAYRDTAVRTTVILEATEVPEPTSLGLQDATETEIARVKGALSRLEIDYVKQFQPALTESYVAQARRTLRRAYDRGERDAGLLAELGLCECDAGNDVGAEPLLGAAIDAGSARPRVAYELARIRYQNAHDRGFGLRLKPDQLAEVVALLNHARTEPPPMAEVYELLAAVWLREETPLRPAELAILDEGVALFARNWRLFYSAAMLNELNGNRVRARELTRRGLEFIRDERVRARFLKLQSLVAEHGSERRENRRAETAVSK